MRIMVFKMPKFLGGFLRKVLKMNWRDAIHIQAVYLTIYT